MNKWGIWHCQPGVYTGWCGFAAGGVFIPMRFDEKEAKEVAARSEFFEARIVPEDAYELPWNEEARKKSTDESN